MDNKIVPLGTPRVSYGDASLIGIKHEVTFVSGGAVSREPLVNAIEAGATDVRFTCYGNKLVCEDNGKGFANLDNLLDAARRLAIPYIGAEIGHFRIGLKVAGLAVRSQDASYTNTQYPYLIVLTQNSNGLAAQIDLYDDGFAYAYIPAFRKVSGTVIVFTGKNPEHDTFTNPPYPVKSTTQRWLGQDIESRMADTPGVKVTVPMSATHKGGTDYGTSRITGLLPILRKDGCEEVKGHIGEYQATFFIMPKPATMKFLKERTKWSGEDRPVGGLVLLRDGNELFEWQDRSVTVPVELLGFKQSGNRRITVVINVTGTGFVTNQARTRMSDPYNADPFPHNVNETAPRAVKAAVKDAVMTAAFRSGVQEVERWAVHITRTFGTWFLDRRGKLVGVKPSEVTPKQPVLTIGLPPNAEPDTTKYNGPYAPDAEKPFPELRPAKELTAEEFKEEAKAKKRKRVSHVTGTPKVVYTALQNIPGDPAVRIVSDSKGEVVVELNYGSKMFTHIVTRCPDLSCFTEKALCEALTGNYWLEQRVLGILFFAEEPVSGDISYILSGIADLCSAFKKGVIEKQQKVNSATA